MVFDMLQIGCAYNAQGIYQCAIASAHTIIIADPAKTGPVMAGRVLSVAVGSLLVLVTAVLKCQCTCSGQCMPLTQLHVLQSLQVFVVAEVMAVELEGKTSMCMYYMRDIHVHVLYICVAIMIICIHVVHDDNNYT